MSVLPGETFMVRAKVWTEGGPGAPYLGVCLPAGWQVADNTVTCTGVYHENLVYNVDLSVEQEALSPAPEGYTWWVADGNSVQTDSGTVLGEIHIQTGDGIGPFSLTYMLGNSYDGLNHERSDNHVIYVLDEYLPRGLQAVGRGDAVSLSWLQPSQGEGLVGYQVYRDGQRISTHAVQDTTYEDKGLTSGVFSYSVSSLYDDGSEHVLPYALRIFLFSGGTGQPDDPYFIATAEDLFLLADSPDVYQKHFALTADIDLDPNLPGRRVFERAAIAPDVNDADEEFQGIPFHGTFDGNGHVISNLTIVGSGHLGLFGMLEPEAVVKNLSIVDCMIDGSDAKVGALAGANGGELSGCHSSGTVSGTECVGGLVGTNLSTGRRDDVLIGRITTSHSTSTVNGNYRVGGLAGFNKSYITRCYSTARVTGNSAVGGLVGANSRTITQCYSCATVQADEQGGGLVGKNAGLGNHGWGGGYREAVVSDCYSIVNSNCQIAGLLIGQNGGWLMDDYSFYPSLITNCYATCDSDAGVIASGLVGVNIWERVLNCFWDAEVTGVADSSEGGTAKTTAEMQSAEVFYRWGGCGDEPIWTINEGDDYPRLYWENRPGTVIRPICLVDFLVGDGTEEDPFLIHTAEELNLIDLGICDWDKHFELVADIDLSDHSYTAAVIASRPPTIGPDFQLARFTGLFDGNGYAISHLTIEGLGALGLFAHLAEGAEVRDLDLVDVNVVGSGSYVGALVGNNAARLTGCSSSGRVRGESYVGGIAGSHYGEGEMRLCASDVEVTGGGYLGGLVGSNGGTIVMSRSMGTVQGSYDVGGIAGRSTGELLASFGTATVTGKGGVGGLVGELNGGEVTDCYSTGAVDGEEDVGGLVGYTYNGHIDRSYSIGLVTGDEQTGGLVGRNLRGSVNQCFWNVQTSGQITSDGGTDLTTAEMKDPFIFGLNGFANDPNWVLDAGHDYPRLAWEGTPGQVIPMPDIDWMEGKGTPAEPYYIDTATQLILLGKASVLWDRHYVLGADIDLGPNLPDRKLFAQAVIPKFSGVLEGGGHTISHMTMTGTNYLGLFGQLSGRIDNLEVVDVDISGLGDYVGGLAGSLNGNIRACHSSGKVWGKNRVGGLIGEHEGGAIVKCGSTSVVDGSAYVGALVGYLEDDAMIAACYSGGSADGVQDVGGLVGYNRGSITSSYASGTAYSQVSVGGLVGINAGSIVTSYSSTEVEARADHVGGLVGYNTGTVAFCYSTGGSSAGRVGGDRGYVGGLVGRNNNGHIISSYSTGRVSGFSNVGGLVGYSTGGDITASFWDIESSDQTTSAVGTGLPTSGMQTATTFLEAGWDFIGETENGTEDIWWIDENQDYPRLWWELMGRDER